MPFLLIIAGASKQHNRMPQKVFHANIKALGYFLGMVCVRSIRDFPWISGRSLLWTTSVVHDNLFMYLYVDYQLWFNMKYS